MEDFTTRTYGTSGLDNRPLFGETSAKDRIINLVVGSLTTLLILVEEFHLGKCLLLVHREAQESQMNEDHYQLSVLLGILKKRCPLLQQFE